MKLQTRVFIIVFTIVVCLFGIIGFPRNVQQLKENAQNRIRLGLDLKGGTHLVLQVQVDDAVNVVADQALERLRDELKAKAIPYADIQRTDSTHILVKGIPPEKSSDVQTLAAEQFSDWTLTHVPGDTTGADRMLTLKASAVATIRNQAFEQSMSTVNNRIDALGIAETEVAEYGQGNAEMVIQLPGVDDPAHVQEIIQQTALLELKIVQDGPYPTKEAALAAHGGVLPPDTQLLPGRRESRGETSASQVWYLVNRVAAVTGRDLRPGGATPSQDENGRPDVLFNLNRDGAARFERVTGQNIGRQLATILDGRVLWAPVIESQIRDSGRITNLSTPQEAHDLALVLNSGALPASIKQLSAETVGPSLGADSIRHGVIASIVGLLAVMAFMLIYYRGAGINADLALVLNLLLLLAVLGYLGAFLTLPGIAGVILTVGMGVDSNVLIFERIREELRAGKAVGAAVSGGFEQAFRTIVDTHVTTIVSAAILFTFGTGPIRGFAVTLTVGLLANLFTSVFVSRVIFDYILSKREKGEALSI